MFRELLLVCGIAAALAGCASATLKTTFNPAEAEFINTQGSATLTGQAFLRRNDGIVVYAAGSEVFLVPKTSYSDERMQKVFGGSKITYATELFGVGLTFKNDDPRFQQYVRKEIANGEGRFTFDKVASGAYYVTTTVTWRAQYIQGGGLLETITISDGQSVDVIMTGQ